MNTLKKKIKEILRDNMNQSNGFTLIYAFLVITIITSLGVTISQTTVKETQLSASAIDSVTAFYAADTALECAMYWDIHHDVFATSSSSVGDIECADTDATNKSSSGSGSSPFTRSFRLESDNICAVVEVRKEEDDDNWRTFVRARGYNTCGDTSQRVERALESSYSY